MKWFSSIILLLIFALSLNAQVVDSDFQKLFDLYIMDKNEECFYQSLKRMEKDKYRTNPEVYVYAMRSSVNLLDDRHFLENNPRLLKDALKYGTKYVKYKNKMENPEDFDLFYAQDIERLRYIGLDEAEYYYYESKYRKAAYFAKKVYKLAPDDPRNQLILGLAQLTRRNTREGKETIEKALANLKQEPIDKNEDLFKKENDIIYFLTRASSMELIDMEKNELVLQVIKDLSAVLTAEQQEKLIAEFNLELAQG